MKSREERNNQFFAEDQSLLDNIATDSWLTESNEASGDYWKRNEQRQDSVLLQLEEPEDRMKLAMEREEQIGNIVHSISDLKYIFKVNYMYIEIITNDNTYDNTIIIMQQEKLFDLANSNYFDIHFDSHCIYWQHKMIGS